MKPLEIRWKTGARIKTDAKIAYAEIERIRSLCGGKIELARIVEESKPKDAPLHGEFEWNNRSAADLWRLHQARHIVGCIEVVRAETPNHQSRAYEATVITSEDNGAKPERVFMRTEDILEDPIARTELLGSALRDAMAFRKRYAMLSELAVVIKAIDGFIETAA